MDKKLEHRVARLEKVMSRKNEQMKDAAEAVYHTANQISQLCKELAAMLKSTDDAPWEIDNALSMCEGDFPKVWFVRFNRINNDR
jgi:predicted  nucleic acid-binding Zn-ribbon protein